MATFSCNKETYIYINNSILVQYSDKCMHSIVLYSIVLRHSQLFLIHCHGDIIQYNVMHKFVGVLDNPLIEVSVKRELAVSPEIIKFDLATEMYIT